MDVALIRTNGARDFLSFYTSLCAIHNLCPISNIKACIKEGVLNCHLHTIDRQDLHPILTALRVNTVLHIVVFYNKWQEKAYHYYKGMLPIARIPKQSIRRQLHPDSYIITDIARATQQLLKISTSIVSLVIEGVNLSKTDFKFLTEGVMDNSSLKHLSLKGTFIGDANLGVLCKVLKGGKILEWIDLTACGLTDEAVTHILTVLHQQSVNRQCSIWKESLRSQRPRYSSFPGLRRITLNINPGIDDEAVCLLAESLRDDLWIKGIDIQSCGLSSVSGQAFLDILQSNNTLMVIDLRDNEHMDESILDSLTEVLSANVYSNDDDTYRWLDVETHLMKQEFRSAGIPILRQQNKHKTSSTTMKTSIVCTQTKPNMMLPKKIHGLPWRTASRSYRRRKQLINASEQEELTTTPSHTKLSSTPSKDVSDSTHDSSVSVKRLTPTKPSARPSRFEVNSDNSNHSLSPETNIDSSDRQQPLVTLTVEQFKHIQQDIKYCQDKLKRESSQRGKMEEQLLQVEFENETLRKRLKTFEKQKKDSVKKTVSDRGTTRNDMDEKTLEAIEDTFKQFHLLLDLLNENGYGYLTELLDSK